MLCKMTCTQGMVNTTMYVNKMFEYNKGLGLVLCCLMPLSTIFKYIVTVLNNKWDLEYKNVWK